MDPWYHVERTLAHTADCELADFVNRVAEGETPSSLQFAFETPLEGELHFLEDDNPFFLSEVFSECSEDEDDSTKLYVN